MAESSSQVLRILLAHADAATRRAIDQSLRRVSAGPIAVHEAPSLPAGLFTLRRIDPHVVLVDLGEERDLALELAREARRAGRLVIGLYSPLTLREREGDFFRQAARAGVGDFVPLPAADDELRGALAAAAGNGGERRERAEGRVVTFYSHKGGVGTSTLAVNTALKLAASERVERGVVLCDAALQFGGAAALLGLAPGLDLADLVRDLADPEALSSYLAFEPRTGLGVLASPRDPREAERITPEDLGRVLIGLARQFGLIVVDTSCALDLLTLAALDLSESVFLVTEASAPTVVGSARCLDLLADQGFTRERLRVVLNRQSTYEGSLPERTVAAHLGRPIDHVVPYSDFVVVAAATAAPVVLSHEKASFSQAVGRLADAALAGLG